MLAPRVCRARRGSRYPSFGCRDRAGSVLGRRGLGRPGSSFEIRRCGDGFLVLSPGWEGFEGMQVGVVYYVVLGVRCGVRAGRRDVAAIHDGVFAAFVARIEGDIDRIGHARVGEIPCD